jgi:eukaryotic-like serine/threonine-protein kinase
LKIPAVLQQEPLAVAAGVAKLYRVRLARLAAPALLKEPAQFWDEIFIANEAYVLDEISHPRVRCRLAYDAARHRLFLEFVEGETLGDLVQAGLFRTEPARVHRLLLAVAETVADLHAGIFCSRPLVHNDIKSMNVLVPAATPNEIKLIDFSHAYFDGHLPPFIADKKQNPAGTARYTAPEKWDGDFTKGFASDVFAFGVLAYYFSTGKHPFDDSVTPIEQTIRETTPVSLLKSEFALPRSVAVVVEQCLEKNPVNRPAMEQVAKVYAEAASLFAS